MAPSARHPVTCHRFLSLQMWKASAGHTVSITQDDSGADDWETDPDFVVSGQCPCSRSLRVTLLGPDAAGLGCRPYVQAAGLTPVSFRTT